MLQIDELQMQIQLLDHKMNLLTQKIVGINLSIMEYCNTLFPPICKYNYIDQDTMENSTCVNV
jgi:hypothetical protein